LNDRVLRAPVDGVVLTRSAEPGEVVAAGASVLTLGNIEKPWARVYIAEQDLGRVKLGMAAEIRTDSYRDKSYAGKVTFISAEAEFTPKQIQTQEERVKLVYRVKVETPNPSGELKSNMPVDVTMHTGSGGRARP
jgi:HlyD family secretion protein